MVGGVEQEISKETRKIAKNELQHTVERKNEMANCANTSKLAFFIQRN